MPSEHIFRAYDVRGSVPDELDADVMERIGRAFGTKLKDDGEDEAVVGRDVRESSPALADALVRGIVSTGIDVTDAGMVPYGAVLFHGRENDVSSAYVTASHLPRGNNGVKFARPDGTGYAEEENMAVKETFLAEQFAAGSGAATEEDILATYRDHMLERVDLAGLNVVVDPGNGAASVIAPDLFWKAGASTECMHCDPDGTFPNRASDVTEESLQVLRELMRDGDRDIGVAYDGDADRAAIVDDTGRLLSAEETAYIALQQLLQEHDGPVVANVECSRLIDDIADEYGAEVIRTRVGHSYLFSAVVEHDAVMGVETSRHIGIAPLFPLDDGIAASLYIAKVVNGMDRPLSEAVDDIPTYERDRIAFDAPQEKKFAIVEQLTAELSDEYEDTNTKDGVRVDLDEGWVLVRASNTSPVIRLTVEAETQEDFEALQKEFADRVEAAIADAR